MIKPYKKIELPNSEKLVQQGSVLIIAEMACAHDGDINKASKIIEAAANAGADAIQLQFFDPASNMVESHSKFGLIQSLYFDDSQWRSLIDQARRLNLLVFSCAYDFPSLRKSIDWKMDGIKFNSSDLTNLEMLDEISKTDIFFTLGTGASTFDEIQIAVDRVLSKGARKFALMHGVQSFPTSIGEAAIDKVELLQQTFNCLVGYADHTDAEAKLARSIDMLAIAKGASVLEKHITLDRIERGTDYESALEPDEFIEYVENMRAGQSAIQYNGPSAFTSSEKNYRAFQKKKIVAKTSLSEGVQLKAEDVLFLRTEEQGLTPDFIDQLINKKLLVNVEKHGVITFDHVGEG